MTRAGEASQMETPQAQVAEERRTARGSLSFLSGNQQANLTEPKNKKDPSL
ncbi:hypothetical protein GCM10009865_08570 [Aeromicrobium ponti]